MSSPSLKRTDPVSGCLRNGKQIWKDNVVSSSRASHGAAGSICRTARLTMPELSFNFFYKPYVLWHTVLTSWHPTPSPPSLGTAHIESMSPSPGPDRTRSDVKSCSQSRSQPTSARFYWRDWKDTSDVHMIPAQPASCWLDMTAASVPSARASVTTCSSCGWTCS